MFWKSRLGRFGLIWRNDDRYSGIRDSLFRDIGGTEVATRERQVAPRRGAEAQHSLRHVVSRVRIGTLTWQFGASQEWHS